MDPIFFLILFIHKLINKIGPLWVLFYLWMSKTSINKIGSFASLFYYIELVQYNKIECYFYNYFLLLFENV